VRADRTGNTKFSLGDWVDVRGASQGRQGFLSLEVRSINIIVAPWTSRYRAYRLPSWIRVVIFPVYSAPYGIRSAFKYLKAAYFIYTYDLDVSILTGKSDKTLALWPLIL